MNTPDTPDVMEAAAHDGEAQCRQKHHVSHVGLIFRPGGVDEEILKHAYAGDGTQESPYVVDFLPDDARNPLRFPQWKKWTYTVLVSTATLAIAFVSTAYSGGIVEVEKDFDVGPEVAFLGISLFVVGFAVGPLFWAPLSEFFGRQVLFFGTYLVLTVFNAAAAGAPNITALIVFRFLSGCFGSSPLTNAGGVIADMFTASQRGLATAVFSAQVFLGPSIGPIVGGFLGEATGWRWVEGLMAIFTGVIWLVCSLVVPETYAPVLLRKRAATLSRATGRVYVSKLDIDNKTTMACRFRVALLRPWVLLFREPIVLLTAVYMAIVYGTLYMLFAAFPIVFTIGRGWSIGIGNLPFIGVAVGMLFGVGYSIWDNKRYIAMVERNGGMAAPEARLPPSIIASVLLPVGLFWFAWTNGPEVPWIVPTIASAFFGAGLVLVFLSLLNYLIDSYVVFAASVLAASAVTRSLFGAAFPLFTDYMYLKLGVHWASSVPAFLALACMPFPYLFYRHGHAIRARCAYAAEAAAVLDRMRATLDDRDHPETGTETGTETETETATSEKQPRGQLTDSDTAVGTASDDDAARKETV